MSSPNSPNPAPPSSAGCSVSDKAAINAFSPAAASSSQPCAGESPQTPRKPCDVKDVVIREKLANLDRHFVKDKNDPKGGWVEKPPDSEPRAISILGAAGAPKNQANKLQVVSFPKGSNRVTKIAVVVTPFAVDDPEHIALRIDRPNEATISRLCRKEQTEEFEVHSAELQGSLASRIFQRFWTHSAPVNHYWIEVVSCGHRNSGPVVGTARMAVEVFNGDQIKLALKLPSLRKFTAEYKKGVKAAIGDDGKLTKESVNEYETKDVRRDGDGVVTDTKSRDYHAGTSSDVTTVENKRGKFTAEESVDSSGGFDITTAGTRRESSTPDAPSLQLTVNGKDLDVVVDLKKLLQVIADVKEGIKAIQDLIKEWVPQAGFKFEFEFEFCSGSIAAAWGYREHTDWRVYYGFDLELVFTILRISLWASLGFQVGLILARVECGIDDAKFEVSQKWQFNTPDKPFNPSFKEEVDVPIVLRGRAEAGITNYKVRAEAGLRSGFNCTAEIKCDEHTAFSVEVDMKWLGLDGYVITKSSPTKAEEAHHRHFIDESPIWKGPLPI